MDAALRNVPTCSEASEGGAVSEPAKVEYFIVWNVRPHADDPRKQFTEGVAGVKEAIQLVFEREKFEGRNLRDDEYDLAVVEWYRNDVTSQLEGWMKRWAPDDSDYVFAALVDGERPNYAQ